MALSYTGAIDPATADELDVVVARQADRIPRLRHRHDELQHARRVRAAIAVVADEHRAPPPRRGRRPAVAAELVAEPAQELRELDVAAVDVADDVERSVIYSSVGPQRRAPDLRGVDLLRGSKQRNAPEALALQPP